MAKETINQVIPVIYNQDLPSIAFDNFFEAVIKMILKMFWAGKLAAQIITDRLKYSKASQKKYTLVMNDST